MYVRVGLWGGDEVDGGGALTNGISALMKRIPESSSFYHMRKSRKTSVNL